MYNQTPLHVGHLSEIGNGLTYRDFSFAVDEKAFSAIESILLLSTFLRNKWKSVTMCATLVGSAIIATTHMNSSDGRVSSMSISLRLFDPRELKSKFRCIRSPRQCSHAPQTKKIRTALRGAFRGTCSSVKFYFMLEYSMSYSIYSQIPEGFQFREPSRL